MVSLTSDSARPPPARPTAQGRPGPGRQEAGPRHPPHHRRRLRQGRRRQIHHRRQPRARLSHAEGLRIGILDADLYGPSIPKLLGLEGKPAVRDDGIFAPHDAYGLKVMSIGSMLTADQAVVWRGPMATSALRQLLRESDWGELDVLVVDLPPGTGDIQISLFQQVPSSTGAVIVSTPQDLALIDAKKADRHAASALGVPILGLVENMSYFIAPDTGTRYDIFGHGGAQAAAAAMEMPFLGEIPLVMSIREPVDAGRPVVATAPMAPSPSLPRHRQKLLADPQLRP